VPSACVISGVFGPVVHGPRFCFFSWILDMTLNTNSAEQVLNWSSFPRACSVQLFSPPTAVQLEVYFYIGACLVSFVMLETRVFCSLFLIHRPPYSHQALFTSFISRCLEFLLNLFMKFLLAVSVREFCKFRALRVIGPCQLYRLIYCCSRAGFLLPRSLRSRWKLFVNLTLRIFFRSTNSA